MTEDNFAMVNSHPRHRFIRLLASWLSAVMLTTVATAQPVPTKLPDSVQIFPAGARRGTAVDVRIGVEQTPPNAKFFIRGAGVSGDSELASEVFDQGELSPRRAPTEIPIHYPRQWAGKVVIASDAPVGTAYWDVFCASGGSSGSLPFIVGDLPEFIETESNSTPDSAELIELPVTVNGQIHGERDLDYYRFSLHAGEVVYCEVLARRLGSRLEPTVSILNSDGRAVSFDEDNLGDDPLIAFKAPEDGTYLLQIGNVSFHGSPAHVYRVNFTHAPVTPYAYPIGAPAGESTKFSFIAMSGDGDVKVIDRELTLPTDSSEVFYYSDRELANSIPLRVLPAETKLVTTQAHGDHAEFPIAVGEVSNGRLSPFVVDVYSLEIKEREPVEIRLIAPDSVSAASLVLMEITDSSGKTVGRTKLAPTPEALKAYYLLANPAIGKYTISLKCVGDTASGHRSRGYQLEVFPATPDFKLNAGSDCLSVTQGSSVEIPIKLNRIGGFDGEVNIKVDGLPEAVTVENTLIAAGKSDVKLKVTIPDSQLSTRHEIRLTGTATVADEQVVRPVLVQHRGHDSFGRGISGSLRDVIAFTVRHKPLFRLHCEEAYQYARRGTVYPYRMTLERFDGFAEPVVIQRGDRQNRDLDGIDFVQTTVTAEQSEFMMPIYLPETMHINIQSQSQLYTQAFASFTDSHGQKQSALVVSEKRNMLRTMPTVVKLSVGNSPLKGQPGDVVFAEFELDRTSNMRNAMRLQLVESGSLQLESPTTQIEREERTIRVPIAIPDNVEPNNYQLTFRASGSLDAKPDQTVITSATVALQVFAQSD
ncbi:MAG: hypothetical protein H8E66_26990 [Planctomycetes bacterium]|nr:hypothetical protein [Planctomycetota bacterium]